MSSARANSLLFCAALSLGPVLAGCVTKAQAEAKARAAYIAGEQAAMMRLQQAQVQGPTVRVNGPVRNPVVPWTPRLTLSQAIIAADCLDAREPAEIIILHNGMARRVNVKDLLSGRDVPLEPGDVVQLVLSPGAGSTPAR
ncbi:MAG TPA: hypothetical protein VN829_00995 [Dongiaceae bacterium]|nr:hypothetical protein [Dongiaceae bacterium]